MLNPAATYAMFGVTPDCSDEELRLAYRRTLLKEHPDHNPGNRQAATAHTQQLLAAYAQILAQRQNSDTDFADVNTDDARSFTVTFEGGQVKFTVSFGFCGPDLEDIARRKSEFRDAWQAYQAQPGDPYRALRLVHAGIQAERQEALADLLLHPLLIDSGALLLSQVSREEACKSLIRWAEFLRSRGHLAAATNLLEDAHASGRATPELLDVLRSHHYAIAQYPDPTTGKKADPATRIHHLERILALGFELDYIYKMLASAYHDVGELDKARNHLRTAFRLNPDLTGAVRLSEALGLSERKLAKQKTARTPKRHTFTRPETVPTGAQVETLAKEGNWSQVLAYANPKAYSHAVLPRARDMLRRCARVLARYNGEERDETLFSLYEFIYYWDVSESALISMAKSSNAQMLDRVRGLSQTKVRRSRHFTSCVEYWRLRVTPGLHEDVTVDQMTAKCRNAIEREHFGVARYQLESLRNRYPERANEMGTALLLARACAGMGDFGDALALLEPHLEKKAPRELAEAAADYLWNWLVFEPYHAADDHFYELTLRLLERLAYESRTAENVLEHLWRMLRWLEMLGAQNTATWLRQTINEEAPGTRYVNRHEASRDVEVSQRLQSVLADLDSSLRTRVPAKLTEVLKSSRNVAPGRQQLPPGHDGE
jgi:tetratricopeptide (TPR) repeat protein